MVDGVAGLPSTTSRVSQQNANLQFVFIYVSIKFFADLELGKSCKRKKCRQP